MSNVGFRIFLNIDRPDRTLIEQFAGIPVANISDTMNRIACIDTAIKPFNRASLLGPALTVRAPAGDNLMLHKAIDVAEPGDIIVVDGEAGVGHALMGEIMFRYAMSRGVAGFVLDGCIRDVDSLRDLGFPVYAGESTQRGHIRTGLGR